MDRLLKDADVFISNVRQAALERMGLSYKEVSKNYPRVIYSVLTGFGQKGPDAKRPEFDAIAYFARAENMISLHTPVLALGDTITGIAIASGISAALIKRLRTGIGEKVSLFGTSIWCNGWPIIMNQEKYFDNTIKYPATFCESNGISNLYECKDGKLLCLHVSNYSRDFPKICKALELNEYINDNKFKTHEELNKSGKLLVELLREAIGKLILKHVIDKFSKFEIVYGIVREYKEVTNDCQAWENDYLYKHRFVNGNTAIFPNTPVHFNNYVHTTHEKAPLLGEHTIEILDEL